MRKRLGILAVLATAALVATSAWVIAGRQISRPVRLKVVEHATTDAVVDLKPAGDSSGDLLTFHNKLYNETNSKVIGRDQGSCIRIDTKPGSWECSWTNILPDGHIAVQGPFFDKHDGLLAVTGGTGMYRNARGVMELRSRAGGTEFAFIFRLVP
ncbi:MAG TPA: dirigent protein [Actinomycetota bacterium]|nr:dirigent protein [Actinomycetota bacterium]